MNYQYQNKTQNGFNGRGFLLSNLRFSGVVRVREKSERFKREPKDGEEKSYWIIRDEFGALFSVWERDIADKVLPGEQYEFEGEVKISKGSTFLNLKEVRTVYGSEFATKWDSEDFLKSFKQELLYAFPDDQRMVDRYFWALENRSYGTLAAIEKQVRLTMDTD